MSQVEFLRTSVALLGTSCATLASPRIGTVSAVHSAANTLRAHADTADIASALSDCAAVWMEIEASTKMAALSALAFSRTL